MKTSDIEFFDWFYRPANYAVWRRVVIAAGVDLGCEDDVIQDVALMLWRGGYAVEPGIGYVVACLRQRAVSWFRLLRALRRGGNVVHISLDAASSCCVPGMRPVEVLLDVHTGLSMASSMLPCKSKLWRDLKVLGFTPVLRKAGRKRHVHNLERR